MNRPFATRHTSAFTLIELLTVIAIIAILMGLLFPAINAVKDVARAKKAATDVRTILHAVEQYNVEYGKYPNLSTTTSTTTATKDDACGDTDAGMSVHNSMLFNTLRDIDKDPNKDHTQNPRRMTFMETRVVSNPATPRDGFLDGSAASTGGASVGSLYDPWGKEYCIVIDSNSDNLLDVDSYYNDFKSDDAPRASVGAFSMGKDKKLGKNGDKKYRTSASEASDDLLSWVNK